MQKQTRTRQYCTCNKCTLEAKHDGFAYKHHRKGFSLKLLHFGEHRHPMRRLYIKQKGKWKAVGWLSLECGTFIKD